jgi:peptidyl-prolyl cis-trans isomerase D
MTMLDRMRRHKGWLKWSLAIVVLTFILLYIPSFMKPSGVGAAPSDVVASVNGREITVAQYERAYMQQVTQMRTAYGEAINPQLLKQLGIEQQVIQQLIDQEAVLAEAERIGIRVSDAELAARIVKLPGFQENGQFIGDARYRQLLQMQRPPMIPAEFEAEMRKALVSEKLQEAVTAWIGVADADVQEEYRRRNEKVKLDLAVFKAEQFRAGIQPTDAELQAHFAANQEKFRSPEKRRVRYLAIDADKLRGKVTFTPQEVEAKYRENAQMYSTPEQIRASHILLKTEGKDEAAVRKQAEALLAKVKSGADFAALAKQHSEDEASKDAGGDLDYFGRGRMVPEFDQAAWALNPGQISDVIKTSFGFHIIKLVDKRAATTRTLEEARPQIEEQLRWEKAQTEAGRVAESVADQIKTPADLESVARAQGLAVADSGLFSREEPLAGMGFAPAVAAEAFTMEQGKVSGMLRTNQGFAFITLTETRPSAIPPFAEVIDKVRDDVIRTRAVEVARTRAATMADAAKRGSFAAAAKAAGVTVKTTELITRGSPLPEVGSSQEVDNAVFGLPSGSTTAPIATADAVVVARVVEKQDVVPGDFDSAKSGLRAELEQQKRNDFFAAYMRKAKEKLRIEPNDTTIRALFERQ